MPFRRDRYTDSPQVELPENRQDPERQVDRVFFSPAARSYLADAWVQPAVDAPTACWTASPACAPPGTSTRRRALEGRRRYAASSAFDGRADTAWLGTWTRPSDPYPWIAWTAPQTLTVSALRLEAPRGPVRRPTLVQLSWPGGRTPPLPVRGAGSLRLPTASAHGPSA
jgi:hypothetical protein